MHLLTTLGQAIELSKSALKINLTYLNDFIYGYRVMLLIV